MVESRQMIDCATLRRNHRVESVLENVHAIAYGNRQCAARAAFAGDRDNDRNRQPCHFPQISRNRFALPALFGVDSGIRAGRVDKRENRPAKFRGELHHAQGFAIAFRLGLAKIPSHALLGVAPFLMANHRHRATMKLRQSGDHRLIVAKRAVAVQFHKSR